MLRHHRKELLHALIALLAMSVMSLIILCGIFFLLLGR